MKLFLEFCLIVVVLCGCGSAGLLVDMFIAGRNKGGARSSSGLVEHPLAGRRILVVRSNGYGQIAISGPSYVCQNGIVYDALTGLVVAGGPQPSCEIARAPSAKRPSLTRAGEPISSRSSEKSSPQ